MTWIFDISSIPRDTKVWTETANGEVTVSHFCKPTKQSPKGWWSMIGAEDLIVAWQPFERPVASGVGRRLIQTKHDLDPAAAAALLPIIEDAGGGA
jgi:hypothetical protein